MLDIWLPKCFGFSKWGYFMGRDCAMLTWNGDNPFIQPVADLFSESCGHVAYSLPAPAENVRSKILTSGLIKKTKTHKERGLLVAEERRSRYMRWRLKLLRRTMPNSKRVERWCCATEALLEQQRAQRRAFVARFEVEKTAMLVDGTGPTIKSLLGTVRTAIRCPVTQEQQAVAFDATYGLVNAALAGGSDQWGIGDTSKWRSPYPIRSESSWVAEDGISEKDRLQHDATDADEDIDVPPRELGVAGVVGTSDSEEEQEEEEEEEVPSQRPTRARTATNGRV